MSFVAVGVGAGVLSAGYKIYNGIHQNHLANQIHPQFSQYQTSPYAARQLGLAEQMFNGRMPGANDIYQGIGASQAGTNAAVERNATDSGQALALAQQGQGQANNAYTNLGIQEGQYKNNMLNNLNAAYQSMINEQGKVYQSQLEKYQMDVGQQQGLRNAGAQNVAGGINDIATGFNLFGQQQNQNNFNNQLMQLLGNRGGSSGVI